MDRIWTFKTARLEVFCEWEPEQNEDLSWAEDDQETLDKLASEEWVNCTFRVGVLVNGELYADDYLGNSVRANPPIEFVTEHYGIAPQERAGGFTYCTYFRGMVQSVLAETRKKLKREEEGRERATRAHDCWAHPVPYASDGALGHGFECGICGRFLQAG